MRMLHVLCYLTWLNSAGDRFYIGTPWSRLVEFDCVAERI